MNNRMQGGRRGGGADDAFEATMERYEIEKEQRSFLEEYGDKYSKSTIDALQTMDHEQVNNDLIVELIRSILTKDLHKQGALLVFLPGMQEITSLMKQMARDADLGAPGRVRALPLHSSLSSAEQQRVFESPPKGCTKVVLSTNIAETSVTIDDITVVIDCGHLKEMQCIICLLMG